MAVAVAGGVIPIARAMISGSRRSPITLVGRGKNGKLGGCWDSIQDGKE